MKLKRFLSGIVASALALATMSTMVISINAAEEDSYQLVYEGTIKKGATTSTAYIINIDDAPFNRGVNGETLRITYTSNYNSSTEKELLSVQPVFTLLQTGADKIGTSAANEKFVQWATKANYRKQMVYEVPIKDVLDNAVHVSGTGEVGVSATLDVHKLAVRNYNGYIYNNKVKIEVYTPKNDSSSEEESSSEVDDKFPAYNPDDYAKPETVVPVENTELTYEFRPTSPSIFNTNFTVTETINQIKQLDNFPFPFIDKAELTLHMYKDEYVPEKDGSYRPVIQLVAKDRQGFGWNQLFDALDVEAELDKELKAGDDCSLTINCNTQTFESMASSYYDDNSTLLDVLKGGVDSISIKGKNVRYYGATLKVTFKDLPTNTDQWVKNDDNSYSYYNTKLSENLSSGKPTAEYTTELKIPKDVFDINNKPENAASFQYDLTAPTYITASIGFNDGAGIWKQAEAKTMKYEMTTATGKTSATAFENGIQENQELLLKLTYIKYSQVNITVGNFRWVDADGNVIPTEPTIEGKVYYQTRNVDGAIRFLAEVDEADVLAAESGNIKLIADGVETISDITTAYRTVIAGGKKISAADGKVFIISTPVINAKNSVSAEFKLDNLAGSLTKTVTL